MHIIIDKATLLPVVAQLNSIVKRKEAIPVLSNILFVTGNGTLILTSNSLELALSTTVHSTESTEGSITIPSQKLTDILRSLPDAPVSLDVGENSRITLKCGKSRFTIAGLPKDDFPEIPIFDAQSQVSIPQSILKDLITKTVFAVSHDESRHALTGIYVELTEDTVTFSATNGVKLSTVTRTPDAPNEKPANMIIPLNAMTQLKKLCDGDNEVTLSWNTGQVSATVGSTCLVSRLIDATFPDYRQVIPKTSTSTMIVDRDSLSHALRRVMLLAPESQLVKFALSGQTLTLSTVDPNAGEATETVEVDYSGEDMEIGFNGKFCMDVLSVVSGERVSLALNTPLLPGLWTSAEDDGWKACIMPMRL